MFKVISFDASDRENLEKAYSIRSEVFVVEQLVDREEEYDDYDASSAHYLVLTDENEAVGTARWREKGNEVKLERFAVLRNFRNKGVGSAVLQQVLKDVKPLGKTIFLNAQITAINFYKKEGFESIGELFYEANIPHYKMVYKKQEHS